MAADREQELARQRALDTYRIVDTLPERAYDDIVRVAAVVCDVPIALVSLIDRDRQWFKAQVGLDVHETPRDEAVCDHAIRQPDTLLEVPDLARDPRFADYPAVLGEIGARFYAGMPLVTPGGAAIGTVCVIDREPRVLGSEQRGALEALARLTMNLLEGRQRDRVLERATLLPKAEPGSDRRPGYTVALFEVQGYADLVRSKGERMSEKALEALDHALEAGLRRGIDSINRVTGSAEFVAVLHGDDVHVVLKRLREAAARVAGSAGLEVRMGSAASADGTEPLERVYVRADEDLTADKNRAAV